MIPTMTVAAYILANTKPCLGEPEAIALVRAGYSKKVALLEREWANLLAANVNNLDEVEASDRAKELRAVASRLLDHPAEVRYADISKD